VPSLAPPRMNGAATQSDAGDAAGDRAVARNTSVSSTTGCARTSSRSTTKAPGDDDRGSAARRASTRISSSAIGCGRSRTVTSPSRACATSICQGAYPKASTVTMPTASPASSPAIAKAPNLSVTVSLDGASGISTVTRAKATGSRSVLSRTTPVTAACCTAAAITIAVALVIIVSFLPEVGAGMGARSTSGPARFLGVVIVAARAPQSSDDTKFGYCRRAE